MDYFFRFVSLLWVGFVCGLGGGGGVGGLGSGFGIRRLGVFMVGVVPRACMVGDGFHALH